MQISPTTAVRLVRPAVVGVLIALLVTAPGAAVAAGTGGITVTPVPAVVDGKPVTSFRVKVPSSGELEVPFTVENVTDEERSARLFVARVTRNEGNLTLGEAGSSPFASFDDREVTLGAGEVREDAFTIEGGELPDGEVLAGLVVEVRNGAVLQRATTLIYLERGRRVPLPLLIVAAAVLLVALAAMGVAIAARRRRPESSDLPAD